MTVLVFLDPAFEYGRMADANAPALLVTDQGATRGDGIFESMLAVDGAVRKLAAHLDRLSSSARALDLQIPDAPAWRRAVSAALARYDGADRTGDVPVDPVPRTAPDSRDAPAGRTADAHTTGPALGGVVDSGPAQPGATAPNREAVVKLTVSRGVEGRGQPTAWVTVSAAPAGSRRQREQGIDVLLLDRGYDSALAERAPWLLLGAKTLSYAVNMAALRYAKGHGAEDVIFTSTDGKVLEGPTSTVLVARLDGGSKRLLTPRRDTGILPGTSQGALFAAARRAGWELGYGPLEPRDLFDADGVWLVSSIRLLAPVNSIDGTPISTSAELTTELSALLNGADDIPSTIPTDVDGAGRTQAGSQQADVGQAGTRQAGLNQATGADRGAARRQR